MLHPVHRNEPLHNFRYSHCCLLCSGICHVLLYWRIWRETEKRQKDLPNLQAGKKDSSKRSNSR
nr:unnamed protein product [Callosobruchus analis]